MGQDMRAYLRVDCGGISCTKNSIALCPLPYPLTCPAVVAHSTSVCKYVCVCVCVASQNNYPEPAPVPVPRLGRYARSVIELAKRCTRFDFFSGGGRWQPWLATEYLPLASAPCLLPFLAAIYACANGAQSLSVFKLIWRAGCKTAR